MHAEVDPIPRPAGCPHRAPTGGNAAGLDLTATLRGARLADTPDWLRVGSYAIRITNDPELGLRAEMEAEADLGAETFPFLLALDLTGDDGAPVVLTGRMTSAWDAPFGIEWLALYGVRLTVTPSGTPSESSRAVLEGELDLGQKTWSSPRCWKTASRGWRPP